MKQYTFTDEALESIKGYADEWATQIELQAFHVAQCKGETEITPEHVLQAFNELNVTGY